MSTLATESFPNPVNPEEFFTAFAQAARRHWNAECCSLSLLSISENGTFLLSSPTWQEPLVMRVHRAGYHSRAGILTELAWMQALQTDAGVSTPQAVPAVDGEYVKEVFHPELGESRFVDVFRFIPGDAPDEQQLTDPFRRLGEVTARMHLHAGTWRRPDYFERLVWDVDGCLGARGNWGDWRDGPVPDSAGAAVLEATEERIRNRLSRFGMSSDRFGLIHSDLRLANLLVDDQETRVIDFDDCGLGWFLYDLASALSFIETRRDLDELVQVWLEGYRTVADLPEDDEQEIPTFIMLRRLTLLAWVGSHSDTDLAREQGAQFGEDTVSLATRYLERMPAV